MTPNAFLSSAEINSSVQAPHEVTDASKLAAIIGGLEAEGWTGRPLLLVEECDEDGNLLESYTALTGSHRIAAVQSLYREGVSLEIPCYAVPGTLLAENGYTTADCWDEDATRAVLVDCGCEEAVQLIDAEIASNNAEVA